MVGEGEPEGVAWVGVEERQASEDNDDEWRAEGRAKNTRLDFLNQNGVDTYSKSERKGPKVP